MKGTSSCLRKWKKHADTHSHSSLRDARTRCPDKPHGKPRHNKWFDSAPRLYNEWSLGSSPDSAWTPPTPVKILFNDHVGMLISPAWSVEFSPISYCGMVRPAAVAVSISEALKLDTASTFECLAKRRAKIQLMCQLANASLFFHMPDPKCVLSKTCLWRQQSNIPGLKMCWNALNRSTKHQFAWK